MNIMPPGRFVRASELLQVGLAACSIQYFSTWKKGFVENRWKLAPGSPLTVAMLATAYASADWARGDKLEAALLVAQLYPAFFEVEPNNDFMSTSEHLLGKLAGYGSTVFSVGFTHPGQVRYFEMSSPDVACRIIRDTGKVHGSIVQEFADRVDSFFNMLRVFTTEAEVLLREFDESHRAA